MPAGNVGEGLHLSDRPRSDRPAREGGLDILVSNAGRQQAHQYILDISTEQFDWTMKTH
jgi:NAD(P)-dependent dehydrogenase (short-subunit alcohol dehydrogenase family)